MLNEDKGTFLDSMDVCKDCGRAIISPLESETDCKHCATNLEEEELEENENGLLN